MFEEYEARVIERPRLVKDPMGEASLVHAWPYRGGTLFLWFDITREWIRANLEASGSTDSTEFIDFNNMRLYWQASYGTAKRIMSASLEVRSKDILTALHWSLSGRRNRIDVDSDVQRELFLELAVPEITDFLARILND